MLISVISNGREPVLSYGTLKTETSKLEKKLKESLFNHNKDSKLFTRNTINKQSHTGPLILNFVNLNMFVSWAYCSMLLKVLLDWVYFIAAVLL